MDDKLHDHAKHRRAGLSAMGLWTTAGSWCADNLTDGFVPDEVCARWDRTYRKLAARLVEVGFWTTAEKDGEQGWQFHDWFDFQPTAEQVLAERAAAAERQRKAREAAKARRNAARSGELPPSSQRESRRDIQGDSQGSNGVSHGPPDPTRPDPTRTTKPPAGAAAPPGAQHLVGEWIDHCDARPPKAVIGQVAKTVGQLLAEGIPYADVRAGLSSWHAKRLHPSTIPSEVHAVRLGPPAAAGQPKPSTTDQRVAAGMDLVEQLRAAERTQPQIGA